MGAPGAVGDEVMRGGARPRRGRPSCCARCLRRLAERGAVWIPLPDVLQKLVPEHSREVVRALGAAVLEATGGA